MDDETARNVFTLLRSRYETYDSILASIESASVEDYVARALLDDVKQSTKALVAKVADLANAYASESARVTSLRADLTALAALFEAAEQCFAETSDEIDLRLDLILSVVRYRRVLRGEDHEIDLSIVPFDEITSTSAEVDECVMTAIANAASARPRARRFVTELLGEVPGAEAKIRRLRPD